MSARTDALVSRAETGKINSASIFPVVAGCHPAVRPLTRDPGQKFSNLHFPAAIRRSLTSRRTSSLPPMRRQTSAHSAQIAAHSLWWLERPRLLDGGGRERNLEELIAIFIGHRNEIAFPDHVRFLGSKPVSNKIAVSFRLLVVVAIVTDHVACRNIAIQMKEIPGHAGKLWPDRLVPKGKALLFQDHGQGLKHCSRQYWPVQKK
jgi:hypothetical protein